jgi:UDPglucose 6-dehydrogenase
LRVGFVGLGYVGLTTAVCMASRGLKVVGFDVDARKIETIAAGSTPFTEPGLGKMLRRVLRNRMFECSSDPSILREADVVFITVGTPSNEDGSINLSYVVDAAKTVGGVLNSGGKVSTVVVKSTVVPGTTRGVVRSVLEESSGKVVGEGLNLCVNPEFLREGSAVKDMMKPDRIVIGDDLGGGARVLLRLYGRMYRSRRIPVVVTNTVNAEMIKYASNVFLAAKISLANELANICQRIPGADFKVVAEGLGLDKRIGPYFLGAGLGFGGSCFPKDLRALKEFGKKVGVTPYILEAVERVNLEQPYKALELAEQLVGDLRGKTAAVLGLAFKPNTDDVREAVSLKVVESLLEKGCRVRVYDPAAIDNFRKIFDNTVAYAENAQDCIRDADLAIIVTEWDEFRKLGPEDFVKLMKKPVLVDGRRIYDPEKYVGRVMFAAVGLGPR